jgi:hypothetical protein
MIVRERLQRCTAALAQSDLPAGAESRWVKNLYYWLGFYDALTGAKP